MMFLRAAVVLFFVSGTVCAQSSIESVFKNPTKIKARPVETGTTTETKTDEAKTDEAKTDEAKTEGTKTTETNTSEKKSFGVFGKRSNNAASTKSEGSRSISVFGGKRSEKNVEEKPQGKQGKELASDDPRSAPKFMWPVAGGRISSFYGWRNSRRFHDGIDIVAPAGTKVFASKGGEVIYSDSRIRGYGNMIVIRGNESLNTVYAHNKSNLVKKGDVVSQGELIAYVGNTGHSTGSHMHFEIRKGKYTVDPLKYLDDRDVKKHSGNYKNTDVGLNSEQAE